MLDRMTPRSAFVAVCEARWLFGDEAAAQCFKDIAAASEEAFKLAKAFVSAVSAGQIPASDAASGKRCSPVNPQEGLVEAFARLTADDGLREPWPTAEPEPRFLINRSDVEQFISIWLKENGLDDMRLDGAPSQPSATAKDARRPQTDIHLDQNIILSAAPPIERQLLRLPEVKRLTGLSKSGIYARMKDADFPKQKNLGPQTVAWWSDEVVQWISSRT
jgi:prophage regulatory protein